MSPHRKTIGQVDWFRVPVEADSSPKTEVRRRTVKNIPPFFPHESHAEVVQPTVQPIAQSLNSGSLIVAGSDSVLRRS